MSHPTATTHTVKESAHGHAAHPATAMGVDTRKMGVWAFIGSEVMFFAALIVVYLVYKPVNAARPDFQDPKQYLDIFFTSLLAAILLGSSLTMVLSLAAIRRGDWRRFRIWHLGTVFLGLCFLGGQAYEFYELYHHHAEAGHAGVTGPATLTSSMFGTTFFVLTGFHGTHVAIGVIWLLSVFLKVMRYPRSPENEMDVELAGLYWHFVDLVWVAIFTLIYLI
jgi:cytochrome c oxidase subunit 3/cytochrome o ubiquinol oxidase subunit 3